MEKQSVLNYQVEITDLNNQKKCFNIHSVCRGCLQNEDLKTMKETIVDDIDAIICYESLTKRQLDLRIPPMMCTSCIARLSETHNFFKVLSWADNVLQKALDKIQFEKTEIMEESDETVIKDECGDNFLNDSIICSETNYSSDDEVPLLEKFNIDIEEAKNNLKKWDVLEESDSINRMHSRKDNKDQEDYLFDAQICLLCEEEAGDLEEHLNEIHHIDWLGLRCLKCPFVTNDSLKLTDHSKDCNMDISSQINIEGKSEEDKLKSAVHLLKRVCREKGKGKKGNQNANQSRFICNQCGNIGYTKYEDIEAHYKKWHNSDLNCILCEEKFSNTYSVLYHMMVKHGNLKCCRLCLVSFKTAYELMSHYKSEEHNTKCVVCDEQFKNRKALYEHRRKKHLNPLLQNKKYKCPECSKEFVNKPNIKRHILVFHNNVRFLCDTCGQSYTTNRNLQLHIKKFHEGQEVETKNAKKNFFCEACGRELKIFHKYAIALHMAKHKGYNFVCKKCYDSFASEEELKKHIKDQNHQLFECPKCSAGFVREENLKSHMKNHDAPGWNKNYFVQYGKSAKLRNEKGEFQCSYCPKVYKNKQRLDNHVRVHTNERPYKCQFCQKAFKTWIHRKTHLNVHLGIKKWQCRYCQKAFTYSSTLKGHEMTHTGERPHKCPECKKGFISTSALKKHQLAHFRNGSPNCEIKANKNIKKDNEIMEKNTKLLYKFDQVFDNNDVSYESFSEAPKDQT